MSQKFLSSVALTGISSGSILKVNSSGEIVAAVAGTDYVSSATASQWTTSGNDIYYTTGNVGIGTTSPADKLHVAVSSGNYQVDGDSSGNIYHKSQSGEHRFRADGGTTNAFTIANSLVSTLKTAYFSSNVGIGETSPDGILHLKGSSQATEFYIESSTGTASTSGAIKIAQNNRSAEDFAGEMVFYVQDNNVGGTYWREAMAIINNGNVGIGNSSPGNNRLKVTGATEITGNLTLSGYTAGLLKTNSSGTVSLDTNTYLTTSTASATYLPLTGGTVANGNSASPLTIGRTSASALQVGVKFSADDGESEPSEVYFGMGTDGNPYWASTANLTAGSEIWHAGNDGASSGLDADLLDGNHASAFASSATFQTFGTGNRGWLMPDYGGNASNFLRMYYEDGTKELRLYSYHGTTSGAANLALYDGSSYASVTPTKIGNWDTAYGWGNHASAGYITSLSGYATTTYVDTAVSNLVDSAPTALNTLNELAAALGDDASFSTTVSTALGNRLRLDSEVAYTTAEKSTGRSNLGLGSAATSATTDFAAASHNHDSRYYTETEVDTLLAGKASTDTATTSKNGLMSSTDKTKLDGIESGADVTDSANVAAAGALMASGNTLTGTMKVTGSIIHEFNSGGGYIAFPKGAYYVTTTSSHTGAIKITLPVHGTDDMLKFVVDIFDYSTGESVTMNIAGYLYQTTGGNEWTNCTVTTLTERTDRDYTVRFGGDGTNNCLWIGETNSTWSYPQVIVRDFYGGFSMDVDSYDDNWSISFVTSFNTVDETISDNLPTADWDRIEGKPGNATTSADGLMSSTDKSKLDGIASGAEVNVQADWNQTTTTADDYIKNKPSLSFLPLSGGTVTGVLTLTGSSGASRLRIEGSTPTIDLDDSNGDSFYIHVNSNNFYVLADRDGGGNYGNWEGPHPLQLEADTNKAFIFGSEVKSAAFTLSSDYATASHTHTNADSNNDGFLSSGDYDKFTTAFGWGDHDGLYLPLGGGTLTGQVIFPSTATTKPVLPNGFISRNDLTDTSGRHDIWGISEKYYPSNSTAGDAWGIQWSGTPNDIVFVGAGTDRVTISLDEGNITTLGTVTASGGNSGNWNTAYSWGDHAAAGYLTSVTNISGYSGTLIREDNRTISPSELTSGRMKFGFTSWGNNNSSPYADFLHLRSYTDSSGGSDNLVMFKKSGIGMRIWQQTYGSSTAYSSYADVYTTNDFSTSDFAASTHSHSNATTSAAGFMSSTDKSKLDGIAANANNYSLPSDISVSSVTIGAGVTLSESTNRADLLYVNSSTAGWGGLQIGNTSNEFIFSLMGDGTTGGLYDDQNNDWLIQWTENSGVRLYHNGGEKFTTTSSGATVNGDLVVSGNQVITTGSNADVKFSVWSGTTYGIGMTSGVTYGGLNDYAMTFCMNNDTDRGFWWGYNGQAKSSGAMSLTTAGVLTVASSITAGGAVTGSNLNVSNWDTAYGWGNHATAGYASSTHNHNGTYAYLNDIRSLGSYYINDQGSNATCTTAQFITEIENGGAFDSFTSVFKTPWDYAGNNNISDGGTYSPSELAGMSFITWTDNASDTTRGNITVLGIAPNTGGSAGGVYVWNDQGSGYAPGWREIWTSATDGSGSGLDADLLDGNHASAFALSSHTHTNADSNNDGFLSSGDYDKFTTAFGWGDHAAAGYLTSLPSHNHNASNITAGTLSTDRLPKQELGISIQGNFGQWLAHNTHATNGFNDNPTYWGWTFVQGNTSAPHTNSSQWYRGRFSLGNQYGLGTSAGDYWMELAIPRYSYSSYGNMYIRTCENGSTGSWSGIRASFATDADTVDGYHASDFATSAQGTNADTAFGWGNHASAGYLTSLPSDISVSSVTIGAGVTLSESTDRADLLSINSGTSGWGGLQVTNTAGEGILSLMINGSNGGLYDDQNSDWILYYTENAGVELRYNSVAKITTLNTGVLIGGEIQINDSSTKIKEGANNSVNISTGTGSIDIGSMNASWVHFQADRDIYILPGTGGKVAVDGNLTPYSDNAKTLGASGARWSTIYGVTGTFSGDVVAYSDARVKENVETIETPLDKVMKLRGVSFNRTGEDRKNIGVIAQEIREVLPEVVHEQEDGMLAVAYGNIVGLLIEAMKEQQEQIDELKSMLGK